MTVKNNVKKVLNSKFWLNLCPQVLNCWKLRRKVLKKLLNSKDNVAMAYQIAFDLVGIASQELLNSTSKYIDSDSEIDQSDAKTIRLKKILSGVPTCDLDITFLSRNKNVDISILNSQWIDENTTSLHFDEAYTLLQNVTNFN